MGGWWAGRVGEWGAQCLPFYTRFSGAWTNTAEEEERGRRRPSRRAHVPAARRRRSPREGEWVEGVGLVGGCRGGGWVGGRWMCASVSFARGGGGGKQQCPPEPWGWAWKGERQDDEGTCKGGGRGVLLPLAPGALGAGRGRVCGAQVNATKGGRDSPAESSLKRCRPGLEGSAGGGGGTMRPPLLPPVPMRLSKTHAGKTRGRREEDREGEGEGRQRQAKRKQCLCVWGRVPHHAKLSQKTRFLVQLVHKRVSERF